MYRPSSAYRFDDTVNSGYQAHAPITLSGKKYILDKALMLNKQAFKYCDNGNPLK